MFSLSRRIVCAVAPLYVLFALASCASTDTTAFRGPAPGYRPLAELAAERGLVPQESNQPDQAWASSEGDPFYFMADEEYFLFLGRNVPVQGDPIRWHEGELWVSEGAERAIRDALAKPVAVAPAPRPAPRPVAPPAPSGGAVPAARSLSGQVIALDPGHGGRDPGAISRRGTKEKDIALAVSRLVAARLEERGARVVMTRSDDTFPSLEERPALANRSRSMVFVSVHANAATNRDAAGVEVFWRAGGAFATTSRALAGVVAKAVAEKTGARNRGAKEANFVVLREAEMPAVLVELGFLSNAAEERRLVDPAYQRQLAEGIVTGIEAWLASGGSAALRAAAR